MQDKVKQLVTDTAEHEKAAMQSAMKGGGDTATLTEASTLNSRARDLLPEAERQVLYANPGNKVARGAVGSVLPGSGVMDGLEDSGKAWGAAKSGNYLGTGGYSAMAVLGIASEVPFFKGFLKPMHTALAAKNAAKAAGAAKDVTKAAEAAKDAAKGTEAAKDVAKGTEAAKDSAKGVEASKDASKGADAAKDGAKAEKGASEAKAASGGGNGTVIKKKAKRKPKRRCELVPYDELECEPGQEAHHVIPDWMLRLGKRGGPERIAGLPDLASGPAICLEGGSGKEHNTAHKHTDRPAQRIAKNGAASGIAGTLKLGQAKAISARAIEKATGGKKGGGCDRADIKKQSTENFKAPDDTLLRGVTNARSVTQAIKDALSGGKD